MSEHHKRFAKDVIKRAFNNKTSDAMKEFYKRCDFIYSGNEAYICLTGDLKYVKNGGCYPIHELLAEGWQIRKSYDRYSERVYEILQLAKGLGLDLVAPDWEEGTIPAADLTDEAIEAMSFVPTPLYDRLLGETGLCVGDILKRPNSISYEPIIAAANDDRPLSYNDYALLTSTFGMPPELAPYFKSRIPTTAPVLDYSVHKFTVNDKDILVEITVTQEPRLQNKVLVEYQHEGVTGNWEMDIMGNKLSQAEVLKLPVSLFSILEIFDFESYRYEAILWDRT